MQNIKIKSNIMSVMIPKRKSVGYKSVSKCGSIKINNITSIHEYM